MSLCTRGAYEVLRENENENWMELSKATKDLFHHWLHLTRQMHPETRRKEASFAVSPGV